MKKFTYEIRLSYTATAETKDEAEKELDNIIQAHINEMIFDIDDQILINTEEFDDTICFMCEKRPKQADNDMCEPCWKEFLVRQEAKEKSQ